MLYLHGEVRAGAHVGEGRRVNQPVRVRGSVRRGAGISAAGCWDPRRRLRAEFVPFVPYLREKRTQNGLLGAWAWPSGGAFCLVVGFYVWAWGFSRGRGVYTLYVQVFSRGRGVRVVGVGSLAACQHASTTHTQHASTGKNLHI